MPIYSLEAPEASSSAGVVSESHHKRPRSPSDKVAQKIKDARRKKKRTRPSVTGAGTGTTAALPSARQSGFFESMPRATRASNGERVVDLSSSPPTTLIGDVSDGGKRLMTSRQNLLEGKNKPCESESETALPASSQITQLTKDLSIASAQLKKHQALLTSIQQAVTCQVCLDLMHRPYAMSPCGHLACYNCLVQWFTAPPPGDGLEIGHTRKKTCPHCRTVIKERPVEVWGVKSVVGGIFASGLVPNLPDPATVPSDKGDADMDVWAGIFPPPPAPLTARDLGVVNGMVNDVEDMGMLDVEDGGIYRCLDCMHEIWAGICTNCEREYPGHRLEGSDEFAARGAGLDDDDGDEDQDWDSYHAAWHEGPWRALRFDHLLEDLDEYESDDEGPSRDHGSSGGEPEEFSDDDRPCNHSTRVGRVGQLSGLFGLAQHGDESHHSDESLEQEASRPVRRRGTSNTTSRSRQAAAVSAVVLSSDEVGTQSDEPPVRRRRALAVDSDDEVEIYRSNMEEDADEDRSEEHSEMGFAGRHVAARAFEYEDDDSVAGPPRRLAHLFVGERYSDDDDDDADAATRPGLDAYTWSQGEDEW